MSKYTLRTEVLKALPADVLQQRTTLLIDYTRAFIKATKYVNAADRETPGTLAYHHFRGKALVIPAITSSMVDKEIANIPRGYRQDVYVSRGKAMMFADTGAVDHEAKHSILGQIVQELESRNPEMTCFRHHSTDDMCWKVNFKGEGSMDYGGPFRDCLVNIARELETGIVPLFIKTPNNRNEHGTYRDCYILNPKSKSPSHLKMLKYLGGLIAFAIMAKSPIPFNFAPIVWK